MKQTLLVISLLFSLTACATEKKAMIVGTSSKINVLTARDQFSPTHIPKGWVIEGADQDKLFSNKDKLPNIYMARKNDRIGVHIQSGHDDFIVARYQATKLLVTPFLIWNWYVSEHKSPHHPVRLVVGFYGGQAQSEPLDPSLLVWRGQELPPFDRLIAIGYDQTALKRGNIYSMGQVKYYVQRGGFEQTNRWHQEAADLFQIYRRAWPDDHLGNVKITFVGMAATQDSGDGGITFSNIQLIR
ncbi:MAG: hypothetical protein HWE30_10395 [Methylocystaceae bacterium]|nr:hypothetical protein [Methylocystaceae bacterium]